MRRLHTLLLMLILSLGSCGDEDAASPGAGGPDHDRAQQAPEASAPLAPRDLLLDVDARRFGDGLRRALRSPSAALRREAVRGVSRLHAPARLPSLRDALRDPDPIVRRRASLGLGALEADAPPEVEQALVSALAAETEEENRAALLEDLGRVGSDVALPAFREALAGNAPPLREAACRGLGAYGLRSRSLEPAMLRRVSARMVDDTTPAVRFACAYALSRLSPPEPSTPDALAVLGDLSRAGEDDDATVRAMAVRALARYPDAELAFVARRTSDPDWQVAVQAFRTLGKLGARETGGRTYAAALRAHLDRALSEDSVLSGPPLHVLLEALAPPAALAEAEGVHRVAVDAHDRLGTPREGEPLSHDRGLAHCAAAKLVDLGRRWPNRLETCGLEQVEEPMRQVAMAEVLATVDGADAQRLAFLRRLWRSGDARVRIAVLTALPSVQDEGAFALVLSGLRNGDGGIVAASCDALEALAPRLREAPGSPPILSVRPAGTPLPPRPASARSGPTDTRLRAGLQSALRSLREGDDLEGLQSWLGAFAALRSAPPDPDHPLHVLDEALGELAAHPNTAIRSRVAQVAGELHIDLGDHEPGPVPNPIDSDALVEPGQDLSAVLETERGQVVIDLLAEEAPTTVARFVALVREGFFDGLSFHRVVPAFVVQGGDPQGTGYGGPGWSQRCEDNRVRYERGTVGMALAGRDTGGSQFFIAHGPQPHLDGRYTAFGRVSRGMEVVDSLQAGDRIRSVAVGAAQ